MAFRRASSSGRPQFGSSFFPSELFTPAGSPSPSGVIRLAGARESAAVFPTTASEEAILPKRSAVDSMMKSTYFSVIPGLR